MVLHLGEDCFVPLADIVFISPYKSAMSSRDTRAYLKALEKRRIGAGEPKSVAVVAEGAGFLAYLSPIASTTLLKRGRRNPFGDVY